jgi:hypothetical protein
VGDLGGVLLLLLLLLVVVVLLVNNVELCTVAIAVTFRSLGKWPFPKCCSCERVLLPMLLLLLLCRH